MRPFTAVPLSPGGGAGESSVQIYLTARHCELGPDVRTFAKARLEKLNKYDARIHEVRVIVSQERKLHTAEITLRARLRALRSRFVVSIPGEPRAHSHDHQADRGYQPKSLRCSRSLCCLICFRLLACRELP